MPSFVAPFFCGCLQGLLWGLTNERLEGRLGEGSAKCCQRAVWQLRGEKGGSEEYGKRVVFLKLRPTCDLRCYPCKSIHSAGASKIEFE